METDIKSDTDSTETESESETASETESEQAIQESAEKIVKSIRFYDTRDNLRQVDRNKTFIKVVCDRRYGETPKILCMSDDLYVTFDVKTGMISFELRDPENGDPGFWHYWPHIDIEEERIDKIKIEMNKVMSRVRNLI